MQIRRSKLKNCEEKIKDTPTRMNVLNLEIGRAKKSERSGFCAIENSKIVAVLTEVCGENGVSVGKLRNNLLQRSCHPRFQRRIEELSQIMVHRPIKAFATGRTSACRLKDNLRIRKKIEIERIWMKIQGFIRCGKHRDIKHSS